MISVTMKKWTFRGLPILLATVMGGGSVYAHSNSEEAVLQPASESLAHLQAPLTAGLLAAFNTQTGHELEAAYTYLDLANHFNELSLEGIGRWFTAQFYEEINHSRMFMNFIKAKRQQVVLGPLQHLNIKKTTPLEIFQQSLKAEQDQTKRIQKLHEQSLAAGEYTAVAFLKFFLDEQVQEEDMFSNIVDRLAVSGNNPAALLILDKELSARPIPAVFMPAVR